MYELITWFTDCAYFNFIAGVCSMASLLTLIKLLKFNKLINPVMSAREAELIINKLIAYSKTASKQFWFSLDENVNLSFTKLNKNKINFSLSFQCFLSNKTDTYMMFIILTSNDIQYLYGCLDYTKSDMRLITTSKINPSLTNIMNLEEITLNMSDKEFSKELIRKIQEL